MAKKLGDRRARSRSGFGRRLTSRFLVVLLTAGALFGSAVASPAAAAPCADGAISIVAHTDDDLLFLNPDILHDIQAGRCTRTVFVTAGESGNGQSYWGSLEAGIRATYAQMAGVANRWTAADAGIPAGAISVHTLTAAPHVSVVFLRIPDGFDGSGSAAYGWQSLAKLWDGEIPTVTTVDGREWYTKTEVRDILVKLMSDFKATTVRAQDWTSDPGNLDDHSDHWATAMFTQLASRRYTSPHTLLAYEGYPIWNYAQNVTGDDLTKKIDAFVTFAAYDMLLCNNPMEGCPDSPHDNWLERQYLVTVESTKNAARESGVTVAVSSSKSTSQGAAKAKDGYPGGAPMNPAQEWVSNGEKAGGWIQYSFASPTPLDGVTLFDRPNLADQVTGASLVFSDGSSVPVAALPNNGSGLTIRFPARTVTSVRLNITAVSGTTTAVGLGEFEAWRGPADTTAPVVTASPVGGKYPAGQAITLSANETAKIYYTTNGTTPTASSTLYTGPLTLSTGFTLRYIGVDTAGNASAAAQQVYTVATADTTAPVVTASPVGGPYLVGQQISLSANETAKIYYTVNGSAPTVSSPVYSAPLTLNAPFQLRYFAVDTAGNQSGAGSQSYTVRAPATGPSHDFDGDGNADVLARDQSGNLWLQPGNGAGGWLTARVVGTGWNVMTAIFIPGDFDGDGNVDVLARDTGGRLILYPGNGSGGWRTPVQVGSGWNIMRSIIGPGDFDGDGSVDVLAVDSGYRMLLYPGDGGGGWLTPVQVGSGWADMTAVIAPGDFNGDGFTDLLARNSAGAITLYPGDGAGGWKPSTLVGTGWNGYTAIT